MVLEFYIWVLCFISIYVSFFWMHVLFLEQHTIHQPPKKWPLVSFIVPAWNEEKHILRTLESLLRVDYPSFEIIVVDDQSTDRTAAVVHSIKDTRVRLVSNIHSGIGKASAVNKGVSVARGTFIAVVDADCFVDPHCLHFIIPHFSDPSLGAVITPIKVKDPSTLLEKMQRFEYLMASFTRRMMSQVNTIQVTPGALSVYPKKVLLAVGPFDEHNIAEDFEMGMRLHHTGYRIVLEPRISTLTFVPRTWHDFWRQRTRWSTGFIFNTAKYRHMLGNRAYGMMGIFQVPLNVVMLLFVFVSVVLFLYQFFLKLQIFVAKLILYHWNLLAFFSFPDSFSAFFFGINFKILLPLVITLLCGLYLYHKAHQYAAERWRDPFAIAIYMFLFPFFRTAIWLASLWHVLVASERRW